MDLLRVSIALEDGSQLRVVRWSGGGPPCLLIHGFGDASCVWGSLAPSLATRLQVLGLDLRGHGDSDWDLTHEYSSRMYVSDVRAVVDSLQLSPVVLVGHSLGGEIAARFASENPEAVRALILVDFSPEPDAAVVERTIQDFSDMPRTYRSLEEYLAWLEQRRPLASQDALYQYASYCLDQSKQLLEIKNDPALKNRASTRKAGCSDDQASALWEVLSRITCRCLVVRGEASSILSASVAQRMVTHALVDGLLAVVQRAGHCVMLDNPVGFAGIVSEFLESIFSRSDQGASIP